MLFFFYSTSFASVCVELLTNKLCWYEVGIIIALAGERSTLDTNSTAYQVGFAPKSIGKSTLTPNDKG